MQLASNFWKAYGKSTTNEPCRVINENGIATDPRKIESAKDWPTEYARCEKLLMTAHITGNLLKIYQQLLNLCIDWQKQMFFLNGVINVKSPFKTLLPNFGGFHRTLQRVRLVNRGRLLRQTPGPVPFGTYIFVLMLRSLSPELVMFSDFEFWTSLGTSILLQTLKRGLISTRILAIQIYNWHRRK